MFSGQYDYSTRPTNQYPPAPVHTSQMAYELLSLVEIYKIVRPMRVLEIGAEHGGTLYHWLTNAQPDSTVAVVDLWDSQTIPHNPEMRWRSWCPEGVDFHVIFGNSQTEEMRDRVAEIMPEIDFLFIDGDHTYTGVKNDFMLYGPLVKSGVIAFHDLLKPSFSPHIGVGKLWREIQRAGYVTKEIYALPTDSQRWGGIGVVVIQ